MPADDNIIFEAMPDFMNLVLETDSQDKQECEMEYDSLFCEIEEKCNPSQFVEPMFNKEKFEIANRIYGELMSRRGLPDNELRDLRNMAIEEFGIRFSTKKEYEYLMKYLNPKVYINMQPYDAKRVQTAGHFHERLCKWRNDILALEQLHSDALSFIRLRLDEEEESERRENERREKEKERIAAEEAKNRRSTLIFLPIMVIVMVLCIVMANSSQ